MGSPTSGLRDGGRVAGCWFLGSHASHHFLQARFHAVAGNPGIFSPPTYRYVCINAAVHVMQTRYDGEREITCYGAEKALRHPFAKQMSPEI